MKKFSVKSFPWSPGIPWKVRRGKYVVPELPAELVSSVLRGKEAVVCAFGGLLESFYSLSILETLNKNLLAKKLYWAGNSEYEPLVAANSLAQPFYDTVTAQDTQRFPTPIFLDRDGRVYFNCLNNYLERKPYYSSRGFPDDRAAIQQIVETSTLQWDDKYIPELRYPEEFGDFSELFRSRNISLDKRSVLLVPDETGASIHDVDCLGWNEHQVKSFIAMATTSNFQVLLLTSRPEVYWGTHAKVIPFSINMFMTLVNSVEFVMARDVDFLLVALSLSDAGLISNYMDGAFKLSKNSRVVRSESVIYTDDEVLPAKAFEIVTEKR